MKTTFTIAPPYAHSVALTDFLTHADDRFDAMGELIFHGKRNDIRKIFIEGLGLVAVKRFRRKNLFQAFYYSFLGSSKAMRAYDNALVLQDNDIPTPAPIAFAECRSLGLLGNCYLVTSVLDDGSLEDILFQDDLNVPVALAFARLAAQMHKAGIHHHDLNRTNVRVRKEDSGYVLSVIDVNRMQVAPHGSQLSMHDRIDDLIRLNNRMDFLVVACMEYARIFGLNPQDFTFEVICAKVKFYNKRMAKRKMLHRK